jgi:aminoglycoside phosphotransferase (APT) family kinase protein
MSAEPGPAETETPAIDVIGAEVPGVEVANVTAWLEANIDGARRPFRFEVIAGGHSNLTYAVTGADGQRFVLRRPPLGHRLASAHDMGREHRIISALQATAVPVAPALGFCDDPAVNELPFYVMGFVEGHVLRDRAAAEAVLSVEARRAASDAIVDTLGAIHAVDLDVVGLSDLGKHEDYIARQLRRWHGQIEAQRTRELPEIDTIHAALSAGIPEQGPATIVHGDYRLDNCMLGEDGAIRAVLDWEICTLGDPLADVGLLLAYWSSADDDASSLLTSSTTAPGFASRDELLTRYGATTGRDLSQIEFYVSFAFWKLACILEGVYSRYLGGALGARDKEELAPFVRQIDGAIAQSQAHLGRLG